MARRGRHPLNELSAARVRTIKKPGMYADGNGLYLRVDPSGARRWVQRLTVRGKRHNLGLGGWPVVSLLEAREKAITNRRIAKAGGDPLLLRRKLDMPTFAEAAERVMAFRRPTWRSDRHATQWASTLRTYVYPTLGPLLVDEITTADVLSVLTPIWTSKAETGKRVRQRVGTVMDWAIAQGLRTDNPAAAISAALPKTHKTKAHLAALPYLEVPGAVQSIRECAAGQVSKLSFEYLALTAARTGEVRHAHWGEIDWASRTWTIPAARMKAGKEHRVPLSNRALEVLWDVKALSDGTGLIFPRQGREAVVENDPSANTSSAWHQGSPTRVPIILPRLGGGDHRYSPCGHGSSTCSRGAIRHRGGLCPLRPLRPAPKADGSVGGVPE